MISPHMQLTVGNEKQTIIREDKWLTRGPIGGLANQQEPHFVEGLIDHERNCWDEQQIYNLFVEAIAIEIVSIPLGQTQGRTNSYGLETIQACHKTQQPA